MNKNLPSPSPDAIEVSLALQQHIAQAIEQNQGWLSFHDYMNMALFTPHLGYYTGGSHKIGSAGDFVTAPSLTPLFGLTIAKQMNQLLPQTAGNVYEFGAGTGELAVSLLAGITPKSLSNYYIIDVSPELKQRQQALIESKVPHMAHKVTFLEQLPTEFDGIIIGNEVLDAMPCEVVRWSNQGIEQMGVAIEGEQFQWQGKWLSEGLEIGRAHV